MCTWAGCIGVSSPGLSCVHAAVGIWAARHSGRTNSSHPAAQRRRRCGMCWLLAALPCTRLPAALQAQRCQRGGQPVQRDRHRDGHPAEALV